ncbi:7-carboxy-7-deazaguanine synthase [Paralcaligenes sp. KSB-10]|jgi:7-carboxy-7-deazaguanine synthase (Cx14CxxC type)|uniref:7-carboxy-7-deazaguanine synthase n=1 Tax=Paralcaligenes sp. KSB-10 TaxID=2901142 RepID=UPI001E3EF8E6|nr:7-carboxy-7-deazaguanine synthase [Paralcaligenes sp. KSB-10]UHL62727.1 7-carboxy-7-deazaguanine synthase [Paralcaligenes sp. KSB-10]
MTYSVKEIFYTLQGEGANAGRPAVFCRFAGCNLWTGREKDRERAICQFCDTDFVGTDGDGGGKFRNARALAEAVAGHWSPPGDAHRFVVLTGGEPLLQVDDALIGELHARGFTIAVETNGTQICPAGLDWICVSPKAGSELKVFEGNELKLVFPQPGAEPEKFTRLNFDHFYLQPMDGPAQSANTKLAMDYCMAHPQWSLGVQTHKFLGIR